MNNDSDSITKDEEIEGLAGGDEDASWGEYPIDTFLIRNESRTIHDVLRRIEKGSYIMTPEFQRDFIWDDNKQSKLIESVLLRIPLPVFYVAEDIQGRMIVVDGLQRLTTFQRFVKNELALNLPNQKELHKKQFKDLSPKFQNRVEDFNLIFYIIDAKVPERARLDIFERVNSGVVLTRQQMRNCLYLGAATRFLKDEAATPLFRAATGESLKSSTMRDREFVNRFCAFQRLSLDEYKGDMDEYLARVLTSMNGLPPQELKKLSDQFRRGLANNYEVFNRHAFRKHTRPDQSRSVLNASLWDVLSTGLSCYPEDHVEAHAKALRTAFYALMDDADFSQAITYSTNDPKKVKLRFKLARQMFQEVLGAHAS